MKTKTEIGRLNGHEYVLQYGRMCDVGGYEIKLRRWFLTCDGEYVGDFATKQEAVDYLENEA